jgi:hypothetical protein
MLKDGSNTSGRSMEPIPPKPGKKSEYIEVNVTPAFEVQALTQMKQQIISISIFKQVSMLMRF